MTPEDKLKKWLEVSHVLYFSHFAGLWSSFNAWYNEWYSLKFPSRSAPKDREIIKELKSQPPNDMLQAFQNICKRSDSSQVPLFNFIESVADQNLAGYAQYTRNNVVTRFVKFVWTNPTVKDKIWCGDDSDKPANARGRSVSTMYMDSQTFREAYTILRHFEASPTSLSEPIRSVQSVLSDYGIQSLGSSFYIDPQNQPSASLSAHLRHLKGFVNSNLGQLLRAMNNPNYPPKGLFADILEMLYLVRNQIVHGGFDDPSILENNELFQAAYECLYTLLREFLGKQTSKLHP